MAPEDIRAALHAAAAEHQPDRAAILARIERGQTTDPAPAHRTRHRRTAVRMAGITTTIAAVLGLSVAATWAAVNTDVLRRPAHGPVMAPAPADTRTTPPRPAPASRAPSATHTPHPPTATPSATAGAQQDFLHATGAIDPHSIDNWTQSNITVTTTDTLTTLDLTVRIAATPNLANTGAWSTVLDKFLTTTVDRQPDALVYHFTLKPGATLAPATYVFAAQYNHATGGRNPSRDTYTATATTTNGTQTSVNGGF